MVQPRSTNPMATVTSARTATGSGSPVSAFSPRDVGGDAARRDGLDQAQNGEDGFLDGAREADAEDRVDDDGGFPQDARERGDVVERAKGSPGAPASTRISRRASWGSPQINAARTRTPA